MKNVHFEKTRKNQRLALSKYRGSGLVDGVDIFHLYGGEYAKDYTWWDDFSILMANRRLMCWFVHPRMVYADTCDSIAYEKAKLVKPESDSDYELSKGEQIYKKVGRSRKTKIGVSTMNLNPQYSEWLDYWKNLKKEILVTSDLVIKPSLTYESVDWALGVNAVIPEEVHTREDVVRVAKLLKFMYTNKVAAEQMYSGYTYSKDDWIKENHAGIV